MFKQHQVLKRSSSQLLSTVFIRQSSPSTPLLNKPSRVLFTFRNFSLKNTTISNSKQEAQTTTNSSSNTNNNIEDTKQVFLSLDPETKTLTLANGKTLKVALKETQEKVSRLTQTFRTLLQNAWIFKAFSIVCVLGLLVLEEYFKLSRVEQEFTTVISDEEKEHFERSIERKKEEEELEQFALHSVNQYSMIYGQSGSGKTELCKRLIYKAKNQGIPVFYSSASERQYEARLKSELGYFTFVTQFFHYVKKALNVDSSNDILKDFERVGNEIKHKTGKRPIIIIDNAHQLVLNPDSEQLLRNLQELAKRMADQEALNVIFVVTLDGAKAVQRELLKREFSSRMRVYGVGEMTKDEAVQYLDKKFGVTDPKQVSDILQVAGCVPKYLNCYNQLSQITSSITEAFISAKVDPLFNGPFREIAKSILENGSVDIHDFEAKTPSTEVTDYQNLVVIQSTPHPVRVLLEDNIIFSRNERRVIFKNSGIANYVRNVLDVKK